MRADAAARMTEPVTIVRQVADDRWESSTYPRCSWQARRIRYVGADGLAADQDAVLVQIPEDQGEAMASQGDYLVRGEFSYSGDAIGLADALPEGARRVGTIRDLRGGLSGIGGPIERFASSLVLEAM